MSILITNSRKDSEILNMPSIIIKYVWSVGCQNSEYELLQNEFFPPSDHSCQTWLFTGIVLITVRFISQRVCDCEDLELTESEAAKLVASIEMEMFDIFRNTDSKYMNKYRTIMFNLKDQRNKVCFKVT